MRVWKRESLAGVALLGLCACATSGSGHAAPAGLYPIHNELSVVELARERSARSLYEAVEHLQPTFLRPRPGSWAGLGGAPRMKVYVNGHFAGELDVLRSIPVASVASVRLLGPAEFARVAGALSAADAVIAVTLFR